MTKNGLRASNFSVFGDRRQTIHSGIGIYSFRRRDRRRRDWFVFGKPQVRPAGHSGFKTRRERSIELLRPRRDLGSTGSLPVVVGSLPTTIVFGKLPNAAGWQPALPGNDGR